MKVIPDTAVITALASQRIGVKIALCEWIDNALDAGAGSIQITFGGTSKSRFVAVEDDGRGCSDLVTFAVLGRHDRHETTKLGRFGIGSKDAALYFGGEKCRCDVTSVSGGVERTIRVDWGGMLKYGDWEIDEPVERAAAPGARGTRIVVHPMMRQLPAGDRWQEMLDSLGYMYTPAIKAGKRITIRSPRRGAEPQELKPWRLPPLQPGHVDTTISVGRKKARVYAGIVRDGVPNQRPGLTYLHEFRVIESNSGKGCGTCPTSRIAGFVDLDGGWQLNKNKDGFLAANKLYAAVEKAIALILQKAATMGAELRSEAFTGQVEALLQSSLRAKAKRGKRRSHSRAKPTGKGGKHKQAANEQPGDTFNSRDASSGSMRMTWSRFGRADEPARLAGDHAIDMNLDNPTVAMARDEENVLATWIIAANFIAAESSWKGFQLKIPSVDEDDPVMRYSRTLGALLSRKVHVTSSSEDAAE